MKREPRRGDDQKNLQLLLRHRVVLQALSTNGQILPLVFKQAPFEVTTEAVTELLSHEEGERGSFWLPEIVLKAVTGVVLQARAQGLIQDGGLILLKLDALAATALATLLIERGWLISLEPEAAHYYDSSHDLNQPPSARGHWAICCEFGDARQLR